MIHIRTDITKAVIYSQRARITREAQLDLTQGRNVILLEELPADLIEESVRVALQSPISVKLHGIDLKRIYLEEAPEEKIKALEKEIEDLQDEIHLWKLKQATISNRIDHLDGLLKSPRSYAFGLATGKIDFAEHTLWLNELTSQRDQQLSEKIQMDQNIRKGTAKLVKTQKTLEDLSKGKKRSQYQIQCIIFSEAKTACQLKLTYDSHDAGWQPLYDFRLTESNLQIDIQADVFQITGEDWNDIHLTLSTAQPETRSHLIELDPWYINFEKERAFRSRAMHDALPEAPDHLLAKAAMVSEPTEKAYEPVAVQEEGIHIVYQVQQSVSIPSDSQPHKIQVAGLALSAELDYQVTPRYDTQVVRRMKADNTSAYVLLPGPVQLFDSNMFIGTTAIDMITKNAEIEMPFGFDPRISVEWELKQRNVEKQLLKDRRRIHYTYLATLKNSTSQDVKLHVYDHIPVNRNEMLQIKIKELNPQPEEKDDLNRLSWQINLNPEEKKDITIAFTIDFPREKRVQGLP